MSTKLSNQTESSSRTTDIAIIGMAGRFPDAANVAEFWQNLCAGVNSVRPIPDEELELSAEDLLMAKNNPKYVKMAAAIEDADKFDAAFFGIFPKKAVTMDPHQRLFLECCWHALEDGGYVPEKYDGAIGVFAGCYMNTYLLASLQTNPSFIYDLANVFHGGSFQNEIGFEKDYLATQVSYMLNLRGPSLTIQTACSTSLVAVTSACQSLAFGECDMALAGAATLRFPQKRGYLYEDGGMMSPDGTCKTFDARANGTIFGNGVATILLKRLDDAVADGDDVYAVIRGWGLNNDGNRKPSYTAPSIEGQVDAVAKAHKMAGIDGDTITYIEAHGTGTSLGDPIEIDALSQVFRRTSTEKQYCAIGSVKTNVGHLDCVAGIAGLVKTALAIKHKQIPASLNFEQPNPKIDFANSPFFVNTELSDWPTASAPRRAGVSSFGVGGTNAHVVLEEAPNFSGKLQKSAVSDAVERSGYQLLRLSARSEDAVGRAAKDLAGYLRSNGDVDLADVAHTLATGRRVFKHSSIVAASSVADAVKKLEAAPPVAKNVTPADELPVAFMFPGQGSQFANMGRDLYETEPVYRAAFDRCSEILRPHLGMHLPELLFIDGQPSAEQQRKITETAFAQPAICAMEYSLAQLWLSRNVRPTALIGHSVGEFSAACVSGILSLEDAMTLVALRGQMMQSLPAGQMMAVRLPEEEVLPFLRDDVVVGAVNSPQLCVISGSGEGVSAVANELERAGVVCRPLHTSHAFHSSMMDPILPRFQETVSQISLRAPQLPVVSTVTGTWLTDEEAQSPDYWTSNLRATVRFAQGLGNLFAPVPNASTTSTPILLEVGPGQALTTLARQHPDRDKEQLVLPSCSHPKQDTSDAEIFCESTGRLWQAGVTVERLASTVDATARRCHLPGYPFERKRFWYDTVPNGALPKEPLSREAVSELGAPQSRNGTGSGASSQRASENGQYAIEDDHEASTEPHRDVLVERLIEKQLSLMSKQIHTWKTQQNS